MAPGPSRGARATYLNAPIPDMDSMYNKTKPVDSMASAKMDVWQGLARAAEKKEGPLLLWRLERSASRCRNAEQIPTARKSFLRENCLESFRGLQGVASKEGASKERCRRRRKNVKAVESVFTVFGRKKNTHSNDKKPEAITRGETRTSLHPFLSSSTSFLLLRIVFRLWRMFNRSKAAEKAEQIAPRRPTPVIATLSHRFKATRLTCR
mmetsp:Transcript_23356/g.75928  ORF Transcript_23356/g.75928 Transcript_23356/m.75928 type:complete len:209 (+) Transcript_23356:1896-2522(+)